MAEPETFCDQSEAGASPCKRPRTRPVQLLFDIAKCVATLTQDDHAGAPIRRRVVSAKKPRAQATNRIDLTGCRAVVSGGARGIRHAIAVRLLRSDAVDSWWDRGAAPLHRALVELAPLAAWRAGRSM